MDNLTEATFGSENKTDDYFSDNNLDNKLFETEYDSNSNSTDSTDFESYSLSEPATSFYSPVVEEDVSEGGTDSEGFEETVFLTPRGSPLMDLTTSPPSLVFIYKEEERGGIFLRKFKSIL